MDAILALSGNITLLKLFLIKVPNDLLKVFGDSSGGVFFLPVDILLSIFLRSFNVSSTETDEKQLFLVVRFLGSRLQA